LRPARIHCWAASDAVSRLYPYRADDAAPSVATVPMHRCGFSEGEIRQALLGARTERLLSLRCIDTTKADTFLLLISG